MADNLPAAPADAIDAEVASLGVGSREYWQNPQVQERHRALIEAREAGIPAPTVGISGRVAAYRLEIEAAMKDKMSPYYRGPKGADGETRMASDYRAILRGHETETATEAGTVTAENVAVARANIAALGNVGGEWAKALARDGSAATAIEAGERARTDILGGLAHHDADVLAATFDGLPDDIRASAHQELASPYIGRTRNASADEVRQFGTTAPGGVLMSEWGHDAPRRLGVALARMARHESRLSESQLATWRETWSGWSANIRAAILRRLTQ